MLTDPDIAAHKALLATIDEAQQRVARAELQLCRAIDAADELLASMRDEHAGEQHDCDCDCDMCLYLREQLLRLGGAR